MRTDLGSLPWQVSGFWHNGARFRGDAPLLGPFSATVPGAVQRDLERAGVLADLNVAFHSRDAEWVEHRDWVYRTRFRLPEGGSSRQFLHFAGLDYSGEVSLNGKVLGAFAGMFRPVTFEITGVLAPPGAENVLLVAFEPPPEVEGQIGYSSKIATLKSRFNYQWDWCPRIVPVGIWDDVQLQETGPVALLQPSVVADWLSGEGELRCRIFLDGPGKEDCRVAVTVLGAEDGDGGDQVLWSGEARRDESTALPLAYVGADVETRGLRARIPGVRSWWPTGMGDQPLYRVRLAVFDAGGSVSDERTMTVGFRNISFVPNPDAPTSALPYTCLCNGQRVFLQGINWVPPSPLYGTVRQQDYRPLLERFRRMGCTVLRVWGGAVLEKEAFYDLCDEFGLLVWQELFQSSSGLDNTPPSDPALVDKLAEAASHAIVRRQHHPSLMAWCGGNELTTPDGVPVTAEHPNIARLKAVVTAEDPGRAFFPSSPSGPRFGARAEDFGQGLHHDVHGPWVYLGHPLHYTYFNADDALLRSEIGAPGASRLEVLRRVAGLPEDGEAARHSLALPLWPPNRANPLWVHHGDWWIQWEELNRLFGPWLEDVPELESYVACSRYLQAETLRTCVDSVRRREPVASGVLIWMGNEPYANTANTSLLEYDGEPKPAYGTLRRCFAPARLSCRYDRVAHAVGDLFQGAVFLHVRPPVTQPGGSAVAELLDLTGRVLGRETFQIPVAPGPSCEVGSVTWRVEPVPHEVFLLRLSAGETLDQEVYTFTVTNGPAFAPLRWLPRPDLRVERGLEGDPSIVLVRNLGAVAALGVHLHAVSWDVAPNDFVLFPGEERLVHLERLRLGMPLSLKLEALGLGTVPVGNL